VSRFRVTATSTCSAGVRTSHRRSLPLASGPRRARRCESTVARSCSRYALACRSSDRRSRGRRQGPCGAEIVDVTPRPARRGPSATSWFSRSRKPVWTCFTATRITAGGQRWARVSPRSGRYVEDGERRRPTCPGDRGGRTRRDLDQARCGQDRRDLPPRPGPGAESAAGRSASHRGSRELPDVQRTINAWPPRTARGSASHGAGAPKRAVDGRETDLVTTLVTDRVTRGPALQAGWRP